MKPRIILLGIILAAVLAVPAVSSQTSIILESTFGLFEDDVDNFLDPNDYGYVEFDNAFIFLKGSDRNARGLNTSPAGAADWGNSGKVNSNTAGIQGGFGTWIKNLYLGLGFDTNLWDGEETIVETDGDRADPMNSFDNPTERGIVFDGGFGLLFGTENIGALKLSFDFDNFSFNNDIRDGGSPEEFSYSDGNIDIGLGWGKNFELAGGLLSPELNVGYRISNFKKEQTNPDGFSYIDYPGSDISNNPEQVFDRMSHLWVNPSTEFLSSTEAHWFAVSYTLDIGIHPQTIRKDPNTDREYDWDGYRVGNFLSAGYVRSVDVSDQFALAFGGNLDLGLITSKADFTDLPDPIEYVDFSVNPDIEIGVTYDFVRPVQLYSALMLSSIDENFYTLSYGNDFSSETETYTHTFVPWGLSAGLGLKFTPFPNFILDLGLSQNLSYYVSDKLEYVWAWDLFNWDDHPFTIALQATIKF
ncbi:MAG: hypothetical protein LBJ24_01225 [Treponema sp.]|jgi:hypothetical protein|nr:hypothetical protein [Treponema sp.]